MAGFIELKHANVRWFLSVNPGDSPLAVDGQELEFTEGFTDLLKCVYEKTIKGDGFGIEDARSSIELVHKIRTSPIIDSNSTARHLFLENKNFSIE